MGAVRGAVPCDEGTHPSSPISAMSLRLFVAALNKLSLDLQHILTNTWGGHYKNTRVFLIVPKQTTKHFL